MSARRAVRRRGRRGVADPCRAARPATCGAGPQATGGRIRLAVSTYDAANNPIGTFATPWWDGLGPSALPVRSKACRSLDLAVEMEALAPENPCPGIFVDTPLRDTPHLSSAPIRYAAGGPTISSFGR